MKVIIDTNGLMIPVQFKVDIFTELKRLGYDELIVPQAVINEIKILVKRYKGENRIAAKVALSLSDRCTIVERTGSADDVILQLALDTGAAVLTNDVGLVKRLKEVDVAVVRLRQKSRLDIA
ncbi:DNA-binding protein [Methanococcoides methylutens]|uniref:DNA-binding protein n=1 Tax=Methanococcoides methylutens TaxID=2226 RepID=A0A099T5B1_METMT|nr:DNA-binding protein [Methanococcoides methylutens]KGK99348.1 DNA-binding protein [Methanococcoides methylutens]